MKARLPKKKRSFVKPLIALAMLLVIAGTSVYVGSRKSTAGANKAGVAATKPAMASPQAAAVPKPVNHCAGNSSPRLIMVSISQRHEWACAAAEQVYDSAVITGMENLPADLTPVGTYHIYAKTTNVHLKGSDSTGSWDDPVSYWMPFLDNQYGTYGFHDATWRKDSDFGNISPYSTNASHGCVEQPLVAAKWFYNWAPIGTTVAIKS